MWADYVIIAFLVVSVLIGLLRGFLREVMAIGVWVVAAWLAYLSAGQGDVLLQPWIEVPSVRVIAAFAAIFLLVLVVGGLVTWLLHRLIVSAGLKSTDRMVGMLFGLVRGVLIVAIAVLLARLTPFPDDPWWQQSQLLPYFERVAERVETWLPDSIRQYLPRTAEPGELTLSESLEHVRYCRNCWP